MERDRTRVMIRRRGSKSGEEDVASFGRTNGRRGKVRRREVMRRIRREVCNRDEGEVSAASAFWVYRDFKETDLAHCSLSVAEEKQISKAVHRTKPTRKVRLKPEVGANKFESSGIVHIKTAMHQQRI